MLFTQGALQFEVLNQRLLDREQELEELRRQSRNYILENKRLVSNHSQLFYIIKF